MTNKFYIKSKAKTFYKGHGTGEMCSWLLQSIDYEFNHPKEDEEYDREKHYSRTKKKYVITIKEVR